MRSPNLFVRKLELLSPLSPSDRELLERHSRQVRVYAPKQDIIAEGEATGDVHLVVSGFACRYKVIENGKRQIMAYLVPGDCCDFQVFILKTMDHSIGALSTCGVASIPRAAIIELTDRPAIARAIWWATLVDEAILREWIVNIAQRPSEERLAHLLCELAARMEAMGLGHDGTYAFPIIQADLADMLGITPVHVNRMLMSLRERKLIETRDRELVVLDAEQLKRISGFNSNYLHLTGGKNDIALSA